jgi:metal-responsive CopG/Arc/MetJ family transcriptional regulator
VAKILLSISDEMLEKINKYKDRKKIKRNKFIVEAIENYFDSLWEEEYLERKKKASESIKKTRDYIMSLGIKDWDPVKEIRKFRDSAESETLKRLS